MLLIFERLYLDEFQVLTIKWLDRKYDVYAAGWALFCRSLSGTQKHVNANSKSKTIYWRTRRLERWVAKNNNIKSSTRPIYSVSAIEKPMDGFMRFGHGN